MPALVEDAKPAGRLLVISNRLPLTIKCSNDGKYEFTMSSGGLVTGLSGLSKSTDFQCKQLLVFVHMLPNSHWFYLMYSVLLHELPK